MFTDDLSEDWESSEFQDIFIKDYFGKAKVPKDKVKDTVKPKGGFKNLHSVKNSKESESQDLHSESHHEEVSFNSSFIKNKHNLNSPLKRNKKRKRKSSDNSSQDNCVKNHENDTELDKMQLEASPIANSNSMKSKKKRKRKNKNKGVIEEQALLNSSDKTSKEMNNTKELIVEKKETDTTANDSPEEKSFFQNKLSQKLQAAKFRYLNEMLYTNTGNDALSYFQENTEEFQDYHVGYQSQVLKWPINPVDIMIEELHLMNEQTVIADLGCGEAKISETFPERTVYSFDLIALKDCVTACDMANVPLERESVDVVVFCLSLMGTNWKDYLKEGHRLLKLGAQLKIAEIESRIDNLKGFIRKIESYGFSLVNEDVSHKMFIFLNFKKTKSKVKASKSKVPDVTLKPCLYKKR